MANKLVIMMVLAITSALAAKIKKTQGYDDDWMNPGMTMEEYNKESHDVHRQVKTTEETKEEKRSKRKVDDYIESYDDDWLSQRSAIDEYEVSDKKREDILTMADKRTDDGWIYNVTGGGTYTFDKILEPGDYIELYGTYQWIGTWIINIENSNQYLLHISMRGYTVVLNSYDRWWESEIRPSYPKFTTGEEFKLTIVMMDDSFYMSVDDVRFANFPYRLPLETATRIHMNANMVWNKIKMPGNDKSDIYTKKDLLPEAIANIGNFISENVQGKSLEDLKTFVSSEEGTLSVYKLKLFRAISTNSALFDPNEDEMTKYILENKEILEMLMTSGDVQGNKYKQALQILSELLRQDPGIKENPLKLRLAIATAITHSTAVHSQAVGRNIINWREMYSTYVKWSEEDGTLLVPFFDVSAWHLRYVIGTWQEIEELIWARENTLEDYKTDQKIADITHQMISYKLNNDDGVSVHSGIPYYYYYSMTLKYFHEIGGVCGVVGRTAAGFAQAWGVPAMPVGQPGHCAYIWYKNGRFSLGNDISGWGDTHTHGGIQYTWRTPAVYYQLMNDAQMNLDNYRLSEKMRLASEFSYPEDRFVILEDASNVCPQNFAVWTDMEAAIEEPNLSKSVVQTTLLPTLVKQRLERTELSDIALLKSITSDCFGGSAKMMNDQDGSSAGCTETTAEFEIDLEAPCTIDEIKIWWWGQSKAATFNIFALSESGGYHLVATQDDETVVGSFNHWSYIPGWTMKTYKIKVELMDGTKDYWGYETYFGIRTFNVMGWELDDTTVISNDKSVTANSESSNPESLVDDDQSSIWNGNDDRSWFEIDLDQICVLENIEFKWKGDDEPDRVVIRYRVGEGDKAKIIKKSPVEQVDLEKESYGTEVKVKFRGGDIPKLSGIKVSGVAYTVKDILKMKLHMDLHERHLYVEQYLVDSIDDWDCNF